MPTLQDRLTALTNAFGSDIRTLTASILNKINKGDIVKNVVDYGADKTGVNTTTTFSAVTNALAAVAEGGSVYFPEGTYRWNGDIVITKSRITFYGPGIIDGCFSVGDGSIRYVTDTAFVGLRFINPLDKTTYPVKGYADNSYFIKNNRNRQLRVQECEFYGAAYPVYVPPVAAASHDNSMLRIKNNFFNECDWAVFGDINTLSAITYENIADCQIIGNIINKSWQGGFYFKGIDGLQIVDNVYFMQNYGNQGGRAAEKQQNVRVDLCNWTLIRGNNFFESGTEAILLANAKIYNISDNLIAWSGQRVLSNAIDVTSASALYGGEWASGVISGNNIQDYTKSAIKVSGNHFELQVGPNPVRYESDAASYTGTPALTTASHYRYDFSTLTGIGAMDVGILDGVIARDGHYDSFRNHPYLRSIKREDLYSTRGSASRGPLTFSSGNILNVFVVKDATDASGNYQGEITVIASPGLANSDKKIAYKLFVGKANSTDVTVTQIAKSPTTGTAADDPNFTWSFNVTSNALVATAAGATAGSFYFTAQFHGNLIVG